MSVVTNIQVVRAQACLSHYASFYSCESKMLDGKVSRLGNELLMLKTVHCGFISTDKKAQLLEQGASTEQLEAIQATRGRLLGGSGGIAAMCGMMALDRVINMVQEEKDSKKQRDVFNYNWIRDTQDELDKNGIDAFCASYNLDDGKFDANFTGVKWERRQLVGGRVFQLTIFTGGSLVNRGDGGYLNWGMTHPPGARSDNVVRWD